MANTVSTSTVATALDMVLEPKMAQATDGTLFVMYYDGTEMVYRSAVSPYSTWSGATTLPTSGSTRFGGSIHYNSSDNSIDVFYHINTGVITYVKLTYNSGTTSWSNGTAQTIGTGAGGSSGEIIWGGKDQGGNLWCVFNASNTTWSASYSTDGGSTWNVSIAGASVGTGSSVDQPSAVMVGKYLLVCYSNNAGQLAWRRLDTTGTLTSWSVQQAVNLGPNPDFYPGDLMSLAVDGNGKAIFVMSGQTFNFGSGVWAKIYDPTGDTWGADTHIGSSGGGANPDFNGFAAGNGTDVWVIYTHSPTATAAQNTLLMKKYTASTTTWDTSATTLEGTTDNYQNPNAVATSNTLYFVYTIGTANPWTVVEDSIATSSLVTNTRTVATTVALISTLTRTVTDDVALQGTLTRTITDDVALQGTLTRTVPDDAALLATLTHTTASTAALLSTLTRAVSDDVTLQSTLQRTVGATSAFSATITRTVTCDAALSGAGERFLSATAALVNTFTRTVGADVALESPAALRSVAVTMSLSGPAVHAVPLTGAIGNVIVASVQFTIEMPGVTFFHQMGGDA